MKGGTRIAVGVGIGYVLGRTRKMRFALSLAGAVMARRSTGMPAELLERGTSLLKSSPELSQLSDTVRGELVGAARSAAVTAASTGIDALNDRLQQGATLISDTDRHRSREDSDEQQHRTPSDVEDAITGEDADLADEDDYRTSREDEAGAGGRPATRARAGRTVAARTRKTGSRTSNRRAESADRKPVSSARRRAGADADQAPVRRARR